MNTNLMLDEMEESRRRHRVAVGEICGCKTCLCCEEFKRDREQRKAKKAFINLILNRKIGE